MPRKLGTGLREVQDTGYWPGTIHFSTLYDFEVFLSFEDLKMAAPGLSRLAFIRMLDMKTAHYGRTQQNLKKEKESLEDMKSELAVDNEVIKQWVTEVQEWAHTDLLETSLRYVVENMTDDEGTSENLVSSHYSDVAASTRDIITEKKETEKKRQQQTSEMEALQKSVEALEANAKQINLTSQLSIITPLDELQLCLSQIHQSDSASEVLGESDFSAGHTEEKDLHREVWIEELEDMKEEFVESIDTAEELNFDEDVCFISSDVKCPLNRDGHSLSCMKANNIFSVQASQAYRFLEINISCPSKE
ncbi:hypothetical protein E1301_Tti022478 [Triplophysa tibetana]|uniref:Uncharacterized protein n=1 Tax=Triplophysa tibetana TaxID=1572043 RepID=A0A5A9MX98_9TELE|nr:hypothetical protein E1301_Tti022478 [Triplophysa tibetana]